MFGTCKDASKYFPLFSILLEFLVKKKVPSYGFVFGIFHEKAVHKSMSV